MKISFFLLLVCTFQLVATTLDAQNARIEIGTNNLTLKELISEIEKQTEFLILFRNDDVDTERVIHVNDRTNNVISYLDAAFKNTDINYEFQNKYILLAKKGHAQNTIFLQQAGKRISGVVLDEYGEPIIGANILEKKAQNGVITDLNGTFSITVQPSATLIISYIGYITQEIAVGNQTNLTLRLVEDAQSLDEVVVVGYGTQKKLNLTGAISSVKGEDLIARPVSNTSSMLQGQVPGLYVTQSTGQPGEEGVTFRIRGNNSYGSSTNPLVLINGVEGDLSGLDPNMIESVTVLKDAASSAIYGARAANGVVIVTTKQGTAERKPIISYRGNVSVHSPTKMYKLVTNSAEYMELANIAKTNSGLGNKYPEEEIEKYRNNVGSDQYPNFDWLDYMYNSAIMHTHNLSLAGSSEKSTYNLSLNYLDQEGTLRGFDYKRYNVTLDMTSQATSWLRVGAYATMKHGNQNKTRQSQGDAFLSTMSQAPTYMPWLPDDGSGVTRWTNSAYGYESHNKNMAAIVGEDIMSPRKDYDVNTQIWTEVKFLKNFTWHTKGAARLYSYRDESWRGSATPVYMYQTGEQSGTLDKGGIGFEVTEYRRFYTNLHSYLRYDYTTSNKLHNISAQLGYSQESYMDEDLSAYRKDYPFNLQTIDAGGKDEWSNKGKRDEWSLMSVFGRLNYNFNDRYLLEANARYDGASKLSTKGRWGIFPSFSGAWRLTEESFIKEATIKWLSNAKIRGSWGVLGNDNINDKNYPYQAMIASVAAYPFDKKSEALAYIQTAFNNEYIKWEKVEKTDIGVDLLLFDRLDVTFDWYKSKTTGILRLSQVSDLLGLSAPVVNSGSMQNTGVELDVKWRDMIRSGVMQGFAYNAGVNFHRSRNELLDFGADEISGYYLRKEGIPYNEFYILKCIGVFATQEEINNSPKQFTDKTEPGDLKYRDANGDGKIDNDDRVTMSGYYPGFEYAVNLGASWKGVDISIYGQGVHDKKFYTNDWGVYPFRQGSSPTREYLKDMWTEEGQHNAKHPKLYWDNFGGAKNNRSNSYFLRDASYFRLKSMTIGYTIPRTIINKVGISGLRVYVTGDNFLTFTKFGGLDPERTSNGSAAQYPQNKSYTFGMNVQF